MREALAGLTVRGRAFLAAGVTAVACAVVLDQRTLVRVGVLLVALPLVTAFVVGRGRYRLSLVRTISPQLTEAGQPARVDLVLTNEGWIPTGSLLLEEGLPYSLGGRPRFVVDRIGHGWRRRVTYQVRSDVRGRFDIGPMRVRVADPFGLVELGRSFQTTTSFTVTPRTVTLSPIDLSGTASASGDSRPRSFSGGSAEDVTVREYRRGDDLRRVHWRSSARVGQLMVRREEQPWQARATVFLDNRRVAHRGQGAASSFEAAVVAAASIALHLRQRGFTVRLATSSGDLSGWHSRDGEADTTGLLETLALVQLAPHPLVDDSWVGEAGQSGVTVAVLGAVDEGDVAVLRRVRHHAGAALALALDVDQWATSSTPQSPSAPAPALGGLKILTVHGWKAAGLGPGDRLDQAWRELGARAATATYGVVPPTPAGEEVG
ncbi:DUF58 domain-containing protein [Nocardioides sp. DS6]|uniref:DUF58 domain-containing protein n=1 Tax=Nocardioides eburneus TaxID=3231482 RepID=A0ABV3SYL3_9ACTN